LASTTRQALKKLFEESKDSPSRLRALWALRAIGNLDGSFLAALLQDANEDQRAWAVRLLVEKDKPTVEVVGKLEQMARTETSAAVRLALAAALQRLPVTSRREIAANLAAHAASAEDPQLPWMIWYGLEPAIAHPGAELAGSTYAARIPEVRRSIARRLASSEAGHELLAKMLRMAGTSSRVHDQAHDILQGMLDAFRGQSQAKASWPWGDELSVLARSKDKDIAELATFLSVLHGDRDAVASFQKVVRDRQAAPASRVAALQTLVDAQVPGLGPLLRGLLSDGDLRRAALRALAVVEQPDTPSLIIQHYSEFGDAEKADAIATLTSRPSFAMALLHAMEAGKIPRRDLSAFAARKLLTFKDPALIAKLTKVWGTLRPAQDKSTLMAKYFGITAPEALKKADRSHGRLIFSQTCAKCHMLFGEGGKIGPDLTGSQRANNEYLLTKLLDPSATVAKDYQMTIIATKSGRTLNGIVKEENDKVVTLQTENELVRIPQSEIEAREPSNQSMMPEGQLEKLTEAEVRDLFAYLAGSEQAPLPRGESKK
jgi:putative heme-binding domain-containing protein